MREIPLSMLWFISTLTVIILRHGLLSSLSSAISAEKTTSHHLTIALSQFNMYSTSFTELPRNASNRKFVLDKPSAQPITWTQGSLAHFIAFFFRIWHGHHGSKKSSLISPDCIRIRIGRSKNSSLVSASCFVGFSGTVLYRING